LRYAVVATRNSWGWSSTSTCGASEIKVVITVVLADGVMLWGDLIWIKNHVNQGALCALLCAEQRSTASTLSTLRYWRCHRSLLFRQKLPGAVVPVSWLT